MNLEHLDLEWGTSKRVAGRQGFRAVPTALSGFTSRNTRSRFMSAASWKNTTEFIKAVKSVLRNHPNYKASISNTSVVVEAPYAGGFDVALFTDSNRCTLALGGWYDEFCTPSVALAYFEDALVGNIRVRVDYEGRRPVKWVIERVNALGNWSEIGSMSTTRLLPFPRRARKSVYLRNFCDLPVERR